MADFMLKHDGKLNRWCPVQEDVEAYFRKTLEEVRACPPPLHTPHGLPCIVLRGSRGAHDGRFRRVPRAPDAAAAAAVRELCHGRPAARLWRSFPPHAPGCMPHLRCAPSSTRRRKLGNQPKP